MKKLLNNICAVILSLSVFLFLLSAPLIAQTNFVKYAGNPILPLGNPGDWDDTEAAFAHVLYDGSMYRMWYSGAPTENSYRIGYATSANGIGSWNKHADRVLGVGGPGAFDDAEVWLPWVLFDGTLYEMWYTGNLSGGGIGYITSTDPTVWTRQRTTPVLARGGSGAWDQSRVLNPVVLHSDTLYQMWYSAESASGFWQTGYATSTDGVTWSKHPANPVLTVGAAGEWDAVAAMAGSVLFTDGQYQMWYHGTSGNPFSDWEIGYATSPDGINWTKDALNSPIISGDPVGWDVNQVGFPRVIKDRDRYRMWYQGSGISGIDRLGYAEDFSNAAHTDSILAKPSTVTAGGGMVFFDAYIANPHSENLLAKAIIAADDVIIVDTVSLADNGLGIWEGSWAVPAGSHQYSVWVELENLSAGYTHDSGDWNVFGRFSGVITSQTQFTDHNISTQAGGASGVSAADVDGDGDMDVLSADYYDDTITWYENDGSQPQRGGYPNFAVHTIETGIDGAVVARAVDINGDEHLDVISVANEGDQIAWHENDGNEIFTTHILVSNYDCAVSVEVTDLDDDGDMDVLTAACIDNRILWLENDGSENFTTHTFATGLRNATMVRAVDFDGDGDPDVLCSEWTSGGTLIWYENEGSQNFTARLIATAPDGFRTYHAVDIDGDGDMDVVSTTPDTDQIQWHENDGSASFTDHTITSNADFAHWVQAEDIDRDGDIDVIASSRDDDTVRWFENDGDENFTPHIITSNADFVLTIFAADMDNDGDTDVLSASANDNKVAWYENNGGMVGLRDNPVTPEQFVLAQNYPNPFNPTTTIEFTIPQSGFVSLKVYDLLGQEVVTLLKAYKPAGQHAINFDASGLTSGVYFYILRGKGLNESRKMLLMR